MTLLAGKVTAGVITQEMQRKYAKQIRRAKLEEFKSYLDNGAIRFLDKRTLKFGPGGTNYLTGRWVLTVKVDSDGNFTKFKARWVCRGFQGKHVSSVSRLPVLCGICCIWTLKLRSFRGNITIIAPGCHYSTS